MASGFSVVISATDQASAKLDAINKRIAAMRAPIDRMQASFARLAEASGLNKLHASFANLARTSLDAFQAISRIVAPLAAITSALSLAGLYRMTAAWAAFASKLGFAASRIGISASQLGNLQNAAYLAGGSAESLTAGMQTLRDTMVDAVGGRAPDAVVMMHTLGISFRDVSGHARTAAEVLPELADKLAAITDPTLQARAGTLLLGGAFEELRPFLLKGSAGIAEYVGRAMKLSRVTDASIKAAEAQREATAGLTLSVEGLRNSISEKLAPVLTPMLTQLAEWISTSKFAGRATDELASYLNSINWRDVRKGAKEFGAEVQHVVNLLGGWQTVLEGLMVFMATRWVITMLAPFARVTAALTSIIAKTAMASAGIEKLGGPGMIRTLGSAYLLGSAMPDVNAHYADEAAAKAGFGNDAAGFAKWKQDRDAAKMNSFGKSAFGWIPGLGGIDWSKPLFGGESRGTRNNNPLNLSYAPGQGATGSDGRFGIYGTMQEGIAAAERQLLRYQDQGLGTLTQMITKWAPPKENNTAAYIAEVARRTGIDPNAMISMRDPMVATRVIGAMGQHETGSLLNSGIAAQGVSLALGQPVQVLQPGAAAAPATAPNGKADFTLTLRGFPESTMAHGSVSGDLFAGPPQIKKAMSGAP